MNLLQWKVIIIDSLARIFPEHPALKARANFVNIQI